MHDERPRPLRLLAATLLAVLTTARIAAAEAPFGSVQVQYQKVEDAALFERADGSYDLRRSRQEFFLRALDLRQQSYLRADLMLEASLRVQERSVVDSRDLSRTPTGAIRLVHPFLQFMASHQPAWERTTSRLGTGTLADTVRRTVTTRSRESIVAAHLALPHWPRVDLTWLDRRRRTEAAAGDRNQTRSARVTLDREAYSAYASVNQMRSTSETPGSRTNVQTVLAGGGSYVYSPRRDVSLRAQYDASDLLSRVNGGSRPDIVSQSALLDGNWRAGPKWSTTSSLQWRRTGTGTPIVPPQSTEEGALTSRYQFSRRSSALAGTGFRSASVLVNGALRDGYQKYVTALYAIDAPVRRRLGMSASAVHTTNWDPGRSPYGVEALNASARGTVNRRLSADFSWQLAATGDSAASGSRYGTMWVLRIQGAPLRTLQGHVAFRGQRSGPGLLEPTSVTRGLSAEANWRPAQRLELYGQYSSTRLQPSATQGLTTWSTSLRFEPTPAWQYAATWTRSEQRVQISLGGQLSSREVLTTRVQFAPNRRLAANAALSYNEPGRREESRRLDVTLVWSFGR